MTYRFDHLKKPVRSAFFSQKMITPFRFLLTLEGAFATVHSIMQLVIGNPSQEEFYAEAKSDWNAPKYGQDSVKEILLGIRFHTYGG